MDLSSFRRHLIQMKGMGPPTELLARIPGLGPIVDLGDIDFDLECDRCIGIIDSTTQLERFYPFLMTVPSRCLRIARGAGVEAADVVRFVSQFRAMSDLVTQFERGKWPQV